MTDNLAVEVFGPAFHFDGSEIPTEDATVEDQAAWEAIERRREGREMARAVRCGYHLPTWAQIQRDKITVTKRPEIDHD